MKILLLLLAASNPVPSEPDIIPAIIKFESTWNPFILKLAGCPKNWPEDRTCNPRLGSWDYALFLKSRKTAMQVFDLEERQ